MEPPKLPFTTRAFLAHAYWIALMIALDERLPSASPARSAMRETSQFTPVIPRALLPWAPIVPATWVPCSLGSNGELSFWTKSQPRTSSTLPL